MMIQDRDCGDENDALPVDRSWSWDKATPDSPAVLTLTSPYQRPCEICGKVSTQHADDYECRICCVDHNACCHDDETGFCKNCSQMMK